MRNRSSIFSFSTLRELPLPSRSFLVATAIVLLSVALMHGFRETLLVRDLRPEARLANAIRYLRSQAGARPRVLFLGSSRTQSGIVPEAFAEASGIPRAQILNVAEPSWGAWHALVLLKHAPHVLASVETVFVELTTGSFNENAVHPITHEPAGNPDEFDAWATYSERVQARNAYGRDRLLVESALALTQRKNLNFWCKIGKQILRREPGKGEMRPPIFHQEADKAAQLAADPHFEATTISRYHFHNFQFSQREVAVFRELLAFLREHDMEVVIFHPPVRAAYYDYLASDPRMQREFEKFRGFARELATEYRVVYWETLEDAGLDNSAVLDYGHFSREGALRLTRRLYAQIHAPDQTTPSLPEGQSGASRTAPAASPQSSGQHSNIPIAPPRAIR